MPHPPLEDARPPHVSRHRKAPAHRHRRPPNRLRPAIAVTAAAVVVAGVLAATGLGGHGPAPYASALSALGDRGPLAWSWLQLTDPPATASGPAPADGGAGTSDAGPTLVAGPDGSAVLTDGALIPMVSGAAPLSAGLPTTQAATGPSPTDAATPPEPSPSGGSGPTGSDPAPTTGAPAPPAAPAAAADPAAVPRGDLDGWRQTFVDDFSGSALGREWGRYSGQPGGDPAGWWDPTHVDVSGGLLHLKGYSDGGRNASGGVAAWGASQLTYGKYEVRFRADKANGYAYALLLWPASGTWPNDGEIDFAEDGGGGRTGTTSTLHYGASNSQVARSVRADFSTWHTIGVEWTPGSLVYTLDGRTWASVSSSSVPSKPMFLALQQQAVPCTAWTTCVDASTPALSEIQVDWVSVYARDGSARGSGTPLGS